MASLIFSKTLRGLPQYNQFKTLPSYLKKEIEYLFYLYKYRKSLTKLHNIKSILAIIDINHSSKDIFYQCSKVLRYYFPDARIDFICNKHENCELNLPAIQYHDNLNYLNYGKGIPTVEDNEITGKIIRNSDYSVILNLSPYFENAGFENNLNYIRLYVPFYAYMNYLGCFKISNTHKSASLNSFLHHYFSPIMLENDYPKQVKREYLLRIQNP
jgi:hypothetical protein